jgi:hypothetical protein
VNGGSGEDLELVVEGLLHVITISTSVKRDSSIDPRWLEVTSGGWRGRQMAVGLHVTRRLTMTLHNHLRNEGFVTS